MTSLWHRSCTMRERPALTRNLFCDVCVIGAGLTGVLTAYYLSRAGLDVVVLEADRIGSGTSGSTTGKITAQHSFLYDRITRSQGSAVARAYAALQTKAIDAYESLVREHGIDCGFVRKKSYLFTDADNDELYAEYAAATGAGIDAYLTRDTGLPFDAQALVFPGQAQFHPLTFLSAMSEQVDIYEHSRVLTVKDTCASTAHGSVSAHNIIFACGCPFVNFPGLFFMRQHQSRSYLLALEGAPIPDGMYYSAADGGTSIRSYGGLLLFGGGAHRTGTEGTVWHYPALEAHAKRLLGTQIRVTCRWSAQDGITADGLPYIGEFSPSRPGWYLATGFGKWGMTQAMAAAQILCRKITDKATPVDSLFSPTRFSLSAAKAAVRETAISLRQLTKEALTAADVSDLARIGRGEGGVVLLHGNRTGVYRDEHGSLFAVDTRCPHLGCALEWNADEKSWDCPCHGSRFDVRGRLLHGPAQTRLSFSERQGK